MFMKLMQKIYIQKPANLPGIYKAVEVMKNLSAKISEKDLDKNIEPSIEIEDNKENNKIYPI